MDKSKSSKLKAAAAKKSNKPNKSRKRVETNSSVQPEAGNRDRFNSLLGDAVLGIKKAC